ncbi:serine/threonine protein kinase [Bradyrhizobium ottawaense]
MTDNPRPDLETVRGIIEQIAAGLRAFHRMEMLHQDLRPENILIDKTGTAKIIDFGSVRVAGVAEAAPRDEADEILGTVQYTAPEYFLGQGGSPRSDMFSLAVICYQMLTGKLPYGAQIARIRRKADVRRLKYRSADDDRNVPAWIDGALRRALHPDPYKRHEDLSEFVFELRTPNPAYLDTRITPLLERSPLMFWKLTSAALACAVVVLLALLHAR